MAGGGVIGFKSGGGGINSFLRVREWASKKY